MSVVPPPAPQEVIDATAECIALLNARNTYGINSPEYVATLAEIVADPIDAARTLTATLKLASLYVEGLAAVIGMPVDVLLMAMGMINSATPVTPPTSL